MSIQHVDGGDISHRGKDLADCDCEPILRSAFARGQDLDHLGAHHALHEEKAKQLHNSPRAFPLAPQGFLLVLGRIYGAGATMLCLPASCRGGEPKSRLYSRLNCETLS